MLGKKFYLHLELAQDFGLHYIIESAYYCMCNCVLKHVPLQYSTPTDSACMMYS